MIAAKLLRSGDLKTRKRSALKRVSPTSPSPFLISGCSHASRQLLSSRQRQRGHPPQHAARYNVLIVHSHPRNCAAARRAGPTLLPKAGDKPPAERQEQARRGPRRVGTRRGSGELDDGENQKRHLGGDDGRGELGDGGRNQDRRGFPNASRVRPRSVGEIDLGGVEQ